MTDQNRKTLRSFYCRDYLWDLFEQMTQELGCSMDYLINESMRHYARSRDYAPGDPVGGGQAPYADAPAAPGQNWGQPRGGAMDHRTFQHIPAVQGGPQPYGQAPARGAGGPPPPPPPPRPGPPGPPGAYQQPAAPGRGYAQPAPPAAPQPGPGRGPLYLIFNNNRYLVNNDKFIIGRGSQQTDLTIRDGNISRQHCAVIHRNGNYYIKDLGSTNGIEYRGNRIESKRIEDGDIFFLCDYELRFSYQG
ncbi:FHA domain-containing protein [Bradymonas sediminis]|uniref:Uncharacterized protein n=1 Tax=Bradymonas sediminis TaxID=1548548 RepID=A0A2Z4FFZ9_9DELT|nr:FHA domain-containing protein [Bradymonas sediminis]AWV87841.1 hypothetical protein DN745_00230 [Bradymonas sediminis]TDP73938.1 FHA domain-containing protein [Bradymonas sediminis]